MTDQTKTVFGFEYGSGLYQGPVELDASDILPDGSWAVPGNATEVEPPAGEAGKALVWRDGAWAKVPDHRGETWFRPEGGEVRIDEVGNPLDDGLLPEPTFASFSEDDYRRECARRIEAHASVTTQLNLAAYIAALGNKGTKTAEEKADVAAFGEGIAWIGAMRARWRELHDAQDVLFREDVKWPAVPDAAAALAAKF